MNDEKHAKANELKDKIKTSKDNIIVFDRLTELLEKDSYTLSICRSGGHDRVNVPHVIKPMIVFQVESVLKSELQKLEKEYEAL